MNIKKTMGLIVVCCLAATFAVAGGHRGGGAGGSYRYSSRFSYGLTTMPKSSGQYYRTGYVKVDRSSGARSDYLRSQGYTSTPSGYQVDHIGPLSRGGADTPYNMQLLSVEAHKSKTSMERRY